MWRPLNAPGKPSADGRLVDANGASCGGLAAEDFDALAERFDEGIICHAREDMHSRMIVNRRPQK